MKSEVTLLLICTLFSKALSLTCTQCLPSASGTCNSVQTTCSDQCLTTTATLRKGVVTIFGYNIKTCGTADLCVNGSLNLGDTKLTYNSKCCSTNLCNSESLLALPAQAPNGRMCTGCDSTGCSVTVNCTGSEDRCISASIQQGSSTQTRKGCASKNLCVASASLSTPGFAVSNVQCCEGNLCNAAESFTLSFLLMIVPLLSSIPNSTLMM